MSCPIRSGDCKKASFCDRPGEYAGWLGSAYEPVTTAIDKRGPSDNPYWRNCSDDELRFQIQGLADSKDLVVDRLNRRRALVEQFDRCCRRVGHSRALDGYDESERRALALVTSDKARRALDIRGESAATRDRYGRHLFGQATLMARRLVEAGVRFATVHYDAVDGYSWDSHLNSGDVKDHLLPTFDQAYSALLTDLHERGLLGETLVVALGEMGRTPRKRQLGPATLEHALPRAFGWRRNSRRIDLRSQRRPGRLPPR